MLLRVTLAAVLGGPLLCQDLLERLPADATNLVVVRDVMPHVDALLESEALRALAARTGELQQELVGMALDPATLQRQLALVRGFVPEEIVVATTPAAMAGVMHLVHAFTAGLLQHELQLLGGDPDEIGALRETVGAAVAAIEPPTAVAWVRARDVRTADSWYDAVDAAFAGLAGRGGVEHYSGEDATVLRLRPAALVVEPAREVLADAGVDLEALADWTLQVRVEIADRTITARVGEPAPGPLPAAALGPMWAPDGDQVAFVQLDWTAGFDVAWDAYELFPIDADPRLPADVRQMHVQLATLLDRATDLSDRSSVSIDVGDGLTVQAEYEYGEQVEEFELAPDVVRRAVDPDGGPFAISAVPLDALLWGVMYDVRDRLARRTSRPGGLETFEAIDNATAQLQEYLGGEESAVFAAGSALVMAAASCRSLRLEGMTEAVGPLPFASFAVLGVPETAALGRAFAEELTTLTMEAAGAERGAAHWTEQDLDLGQPVMVVDWRRACPAADALALDADFAPHWLVRDGLVLFSTDPALTRQLLQRIDGEDPLTQPVQNPLTWSRWTGAHLTALLDGALAWTAALESAGGADTGALGEVLGAMRAVAPLIDRWDFYDQIDGTVYRDVQSLRLRRSPK